MGARHTNWYSVLLYDKEYRDMQADEKFEWGTYRQDLRDFQLVSKRDNPTARAINEASGAFQASKRKQLKFFAA
jgi:hypothetical protein